jgi:hypothetical protein
MFVVLELALIDLSLPEQLADPLVWRTWQSGADV